MDTRTDLAVFAHVVRRGESDLDLAQAALLIAEPEYPGLDISHYLERLDSLGRQARRALTGGGAESDMPPAITLLEVFRDKLGFRGNPDDYYDPRNSFLNEVLDRRTGIPITLAVVLLELGRRLGVETQGVSFPGHFLVRARVPGGLVLLDAFGGRVLSAEDLQELYSRATGDPGEPSADLLEPASKAQILWRMLNNLRGIYSTRHDDGRLRGVLERMMVLMPSDEVRQQLETLTHGPSGTGLN